MWIKLLQWYQSFSRFGESSCCNDINPIHDLVNQAAAMISILFKIWCIKLLQWYQSYSWFGVSSCCNDINPIQDLVYQAAAMISILCKQDFFVDIHKKYRIQKTTKTCFFVYKWFKNHTFAKLKHDRFNCNSMSQFNIFITIPVVFKPFHKY